LIGRVAVVRVMMAEWGLKGACSMVNGHSSGALVLLETRFLFPPLYTLPMRTGPRAFVRVLREAARSKTEAEFVDVSRNLEPPPQPPEALVESVLCNI
jgi:hypothetical protein